MDLLEAVAVTYELVGQELSDASLRSIVQELSAYPAPSVSAALLRCRRELRKVTLADILDRIPGGHPKPEEAWAMVSRCMNNEAISIVWTDQMREAYGTAAALAHDPVAARMAFKETYAELVGRARAVHAPAHWSVSLGTDVSGRDAALQEAVNKQQITHEHAATLSPRLSPPAKAVAELTTRIGA